MKFHLAINVRSIADSVHFYSTFFALEPVKHKPGYAKFDLEDPPLNLTLNETAALVTTSDQALNHMGFQVESTEIVRAAQRRLEDAGLASWSEDDTDCCYALQDKVWVRDPDGHAWEIFVVKTADTAPELNVTAAQVDGQSASAACCEPGCCGDQPS